MFTFNQINDSILGETKLYNWDHHSFPWSSTFFTTLPTWTERSISIVTHLVFIRFSLFTFTLRHYSCRWSCVRIHILYRFLMWLLCSRVIFVMKISALSTSVGNQIGINRTIVVSMYRDYSSMCYCDIRDVGASTVITLANSSGCIKSNWKKSMALKKHHVAEKQTIERSTKNELRTS